MGYPHTLKVFLELLLSEQARECSVIGELACRAADCCNLCHNCDCLVNGAIGGVRFRNLLLGKQALCRLSYYRIWGADLEHAPV